jgi:hypothetical protein
VSRQQPFQKANRMYSIKLVGRVTNPREYETKVTGDHERSFRVGITPTQNTRYGVTTDIKEWCEQHFDQLPKAGELIVIDLDEVRRR